MRWTPLVLVYLYTAVVIFEGVLGTVRIMNKKITDICLVVVHSKVIVDYSLVLIMGNGIVQVNEQSS